MTRLSGRRRAGIALSWLGALLVFGEIIHARWLARWLEGAAHPVDWLVLSAGAVAGWVGAYVQSPPDAIAAGNWLLGAGERIAGVVRIWKPGGRRSTDSPIAVNVPVPDDGIPVTTTAEHGTARTAAAKAQGAPVRVVGKGGDFVVLAAGATTEPSVTDDESGE